MSGEVIFADSAIDDLRDIVLYEIRFTRDLDEAQNRVDDLVDRIVEGLTVLPERNPERAYGFMGALRRSFSIGKYAVFYRLDARRTGVVVDKIVYAKADFNRLHFGP